MKLYEQLTKEQQKDYVNAVKRLNERMRDIERHGLSNTPAYRNLQRWVESMDKAGLGQIDKTGHLRAVQTYKMTPELMRRTMAISQNKSASYGGAVKDALSNMSDATKKFLKRHPEKRDAFIRRKAKFNEDLHDFIINHKDAYYGTDLHTATKRPWNERLTETESNEFRKLMRDPIRAVEKNRENVSRWIDEQELNWKG